MSGANVVSFGYQRRPKGRHVELPVQPPTVPAISAPTSLAARAAAVYAQLRRLLSSGGSGASADRQAVRGKPEPLVECGECGRGVAHRGVCATCGGYVMTVTEAERFRRQVLARRAAAKAKGET